MAASKELFTEIRANEKPKIEIFEGQIIKIETYEQRN
jgi:hypothetical protein